MMPTTIYKKTVLVLFLFLASLGAFAQKKVREDVRKGNKLYEQKLYNTAEASYKSALEKNESSPEALFNLGNTYYKEGKWDDAIKEYQKYLSVETKNPIKMSGAWHNIANSYLRKNDLEKSQAAYKIALRLNPNDDATRYNLAVLNKMLEEKNKNNKDKDKDQQNKDKDKDQNKDKDKNEQDKDKDKDQQNKDKDQKDKDQDKNKDQQDKGDKDKQDKDQGISQDNVEQLLQAIEQDEKSTQDKVQQMKAAERKKQNENNRRLNKDW